jgi:hypothetical protein
MHQGSFFNVSSILRTDGVMISVPQDHSPASNAQAEAHRLNAYIYSTSSVQERLMQNSANASQDRQVQLERELATIEKKIDGSS